MTTEQLALPITIICGLCEQENGVHAYWCSHRKHYATDRQQGA